MEIFANYFKEDWFLKGFEVGFEKGFQVGFEKGFQKGSQKIFQIEEQSGFQKAVNSPSSDCTGTLNLTKD